MAYTAWSVVYGEQPTAAKWNQLGTNDAGFKDGTNIDDDAIINRHLSDRIIDPIHLKSMYAFSAYRSANVNITATDYVKAPFDAEYYDPDSVFSTVNNNFIAPIAGKYFFSVEIVSTNAPQIAVALFVNNSNYSRLAWISNQTSTSGASGSIIVDLAAGDVVDARLYFAGTSTMAGSAQWSHFTGCYIGQ